MKTENRKKAFRALILAGKEIVRSGLTIGSGGNISSRVEGADEFVITGSGTWLDQLTTEDFSVMNFNGEVIAGNQKPSVEWKMHSQTYQVRPDMNSVIHVHPQTAVLLDAMGYKVRMITLDHAYYLKKIVSVPYFPAGSQEIADLSSAASKDSECIILGHHGCSTLGETVGSALRRSLLLEEAANNTYRALTLGDKDVDFPAEWFEKLSSI